MLLTLIFVSSSALAYTGPAAHLSEQVSADYNTDGSIDSADNWTQCGEELNPCRYGYAEVAVSNTEDVLQYIRLNASDTTDTNLNSETAYKGALASPNSPWEKQKIYFNSSADGDDGDDDRYYNITNSDTAPAVQLSMAYNNVEGGEDLYDDDNIGAGGSANTMSFSLTLTNPSTSQDLNGADLTVQFQTDTNSTDNDVLHITETSSNGGTASAEDSNGNEDNDQLTWSGDLGSESSVTIDFNATIEELVNLPDDTDSVDLDGQGLGSIPTEDKGALVYWNDTDTLTGNAINGKFTKGPVRQGTDLSDSEDGWRVRGFIHNLASDLDYNVTNWALYNVTTDGQLDTEVQSGTFDPSNLTDEDGRIYTTDDRSSNTNWHNTGITSEKPYFATQFNWEVVWNETNSENYYAHINSTMDLPVLYKVDMVNDKTVDGVMSPDTDGENLTVTDTAEHQGSDQAPANQVEILSVVPGTNNDEESPDDKNSGTSDTFFEINETKGVTVYFNNGSDQEITSSCDISINQPTSTGDDGLVNVTISDVSAVSEIGHALNESEDIRLEYEVFTNTTTEAGETYGFTGNSTFVTSTGTPLTEAHPTVTTGVSAKRLTGYKDLVGYDPENPTLINGTIVVDVTDTEEGGINDIKFMDYVPQGTDFSTSDVTVKIYKDGSWSNDTTDYEIYDNGTVTLPNGETAHAYEYSDGSGGWDLNDQDKIIIDYRMNITESGLYEMPATLMGLDPATGMELSSEALGVVKVKVPEPLKQLDIEQGDLKTAKRTTVGNQAEWVKKVEAFNPNSRPVDTEFETKLFSDASEAWVTYTDEDGETVRIEGEFKETEDGRIFTWEDEVKPLQTKAYEVRTLTPPVLEVNRDVEVLEEVEDDKVRVKMDVFLRNFAKEDYEDVVLNLPMSYDNVEEIRDGFGDKLKFTGGKNSTTVMIDEVSSDDLETITVTYKQPYPTIIVTPEKDSFDLDSPINISVLVINGGQDIKYPKIETEIYAPGMEVVKSEVKQLDEMKPLEETEMSEKYVLSGNLPSGEYIANVRFREDFATLASGSGKFYVKGAFGSGNNTIPAIILLLAIGGLSYLSYKRIKEVR